MSQEKNFHRYNDSTMNGEEAAAADDDDEPLSTSSTKSTTTTTNDVRHLSKKLKKKLKKKNKLNNSSNINNDNDYDGTAGNDEEHLRSKLKNDKPELKEPRQQWNSKLVRENKQQKQSSSMVNNVASPVDYDMNQNNDKLDYDDDVVAVVDKSQSKKMNLNTIKLSSKMSKVQRENNVNEEQRPQIRRESKKKFGKKKKLLTMKHRRLMRIAKVAKLRDKIGQANQNKKN